MSTSDSDYSIDWLASDEEDYDSPKRLSPEHVAEPTSSSSRESPNNCFHLMAPHRMRSDSCDCKDGRVAQHRPLSPLQGYTSVYMQHTLPMESRSNRKRTRSASFDQLCEKPQADTENELFLLKCSELQCYILPLSSILQGLRSGRYSDRLSSFQESVAMDRIQRILGVLQNPNMGGRFLSIVLKIEEMLHSWFPHITTNLQTHHSTSAKKQKQQQQQHHHSACPSSSPTASLSSSHLSTRLHSSSVCSMKSAESAFGPPTTTSSSSSTSSSSTSCSSFSSTSCSSSSHTDTWRKEEVTQDNAVSSSTDPAPAGSRRRPAARPCLSQGALPFKIRSPCLERLLKAKDSIIAPRAEGESSWLS